MIENNFFVTERGLMLDGALVSSFYPQVQEKRRIHKHGDTTTRKEYDIYVNLSDGRKLDTITFSSTHNIRYSEYWDECCDAELSSEARRNLQIFLQHIIKDKEYRECYEVDKLGLYVEKSVVFIYGYGKVIAPDGMNIIYSPQIPRYVFKEKNRNIKELLCYAKKLMELRPGMSDVLFCVRILAVLRPLLNETPYPVELFVGVFRKSGTVKSTMAKLVFTSSDKQFLSFSHYNKKQILECLQQYSGHAVVIDDYHPMAKKYDREKQQSILDTIARNADSGQGAIAVITGEFMEGCFSLQDRMIQIRVPEDKINGHMLSERLQILQREKEMLDCLMYEFARKVYSDFDNMKALVQELFLRQESNVYDFRVERNIRFLVIAMQIFEKCFPDIAEQKIDNQLKDSLRSVMEIQKKHMSVVRRMENNMDWTRELYLMLSSGNVKRKYDFSSNFSSTEEIIIRNDNIYFTEMALEREMEKFLNCHVKTRDIAEHLSKTQVLDEDQSSARTKKVNGKRYYVVNRSKLELYYNKTVSTDD